MEHQNFDTSEMLNDDDLTLITNIEAAKKHILSYFKVDSLVAKIKGLVKESTILDFTNARTEKFIDQRKPVFIVKIDHVAAEKLYPRTAFSEEDDEIRYLSQVVYNEVVYHFSSFLIEAIKGDENLKEAFDEMPLDLDISAVIVSSIFGVRVDVPSKIVHLEYIDRKSVV